MIVGVVEVYNSSARPNTISSYRFRAKDRDGSWIELESERYTETFARDDNETVYNDTLLITGSYSGVAVPIAAFANERLPRSFQIRVSVQDLFGKKYSAILSVGTMLDLSKPVGANRFHAKTRSKTRLYHLPSKPNIINERIYYSRNWATAFPVPAARRKVK